MIQWKRKKLRGEFGDFSLAHKLRNENKTNEDFEVMLSNLDLEETIGLKLELASKSMGGKLYGLNLWASIPHIAKEALLLYIYSSARTRKEAAAFLGVSCFKLRSLFYHYGIYHYFKDEKRIDKR